MFDDIKAIEKHPVYQQVLKDSMGGILYNVANRDKYDKDEIVQMWNNLTPMYQEAADGIMKGAFNFLKGDK